MGPLDSKLSNKLISKHCIGLCLALIIHSTGWAAKVSLPEAIHIAFDKNKNSQANTLQLQASLKEIEALTRSSYLPRFSLGASQNQSQRVDLLDSAGNSSNQSASAFASISLNLYNGGLDQLRISQAQCSYDRQSAQYNSTDTQIQDTKGQIATVVAFTYLAIIQNLADHDYYEMKKKMIDSLAPFASGTAEVNRITNSLADIQIQIAQNHDEIQILSNSYKDVVNEEVPQDLESIDETIASIQIPKDADQAFEIAKAKSPEIQTSEISVRCEEIGAQISNRQIYAPRVDLSARISQGSSSSSPGSHESRGRDRSVGLTLSIPFDLGQPVKAESSQLRLESAKKSLEAKLSKVQASLKNDFLRLQSLNKSAGAYQASYDAVTLQVASAIQSVQAKKMTVSEALDLMDSLEGRFRSLNQTKRSLIEKRFAIQRQIGTLFDSITDMVKFKKSL